MSRTINLEDVVTVHNFLRLKYELKSKLCQERQNSTVGASVNPTPEIHLVQMTRVSTSRIPHHYVAVKMKGAAVFSEVGDACFTPVACSDLFRHNVNSWCGDA